MKGGTSYYSGGGDGSTVESASGLKIEYKLSSTLPLDVYFVPVQEDFSQLSPLAVR